MVWAWESVSHIQTPEEPMPVRPGASFALWTGLDFARVVNGAGLSLLAPTVPQCDIGYGV